MKSYLKITLTLFIIITIVLGFALPLNMPPGWFQQTLPVTETIRDIFFTDSLNGWVVASNQTFPANDTGYIMRTTNGGDNWTIQLDSMFNYYTVQFIDINYGFASGGTGRAKFLSTTNGGINWTISTPFGSNMFAILDMCFVNRDTGWICSDDSFGGGIYKTTNAGINWVLQAPVGPYKPIKLSFINKDTGWASSDEPFCKLFRTTNGGANWDTQHTFSNSVVNILFINNVTGFAAGAFGSGTVAKTTNSGFNWQTTTNSTGGTGMYFINTSTGYICSGASIMQKTTDGGNNWFNLTVPAGGYRTIQFIDTSKGWAGGSILIHTTDGGGPPMGIQQIGSEIPEEYKLFQNYPNPFNPKTIIRYQIESFSNVKLRVHDINGKLMTELVNQKHSAGIYEVDFDASTYSTGIYFYALYIEGRLITSKRMVLIK